MTTMKNPLRIIFRTDANQQIGTGHFMRCLTLAEEMRRSHADICFVARDLPMYLQQMLTKHGVQFIALPKPEVSQDVDELPYAAWLKTTQAEDAEQTLAALGATTWDWLVVDHYALDHRFETPLRKACKYVMAIDDLADRVHDCDVLLDQNYYQDQAQRYRDKVPSHCRQLLGPSFAQLRPEFKAMRDKVQVRTGKVNNILVFFGGVDADNYTGQVLDLLISLNLGVQVSVVIGQQHPQKEKIRQLCVQYSFACHVQTSQIAILMAEADLAIGAGGSSHWERCCLGLPSIAVATAANQIPITNELSKLGGCLSLGEIQNTTLGKIKESLFFFLESSVECEKFSKTAFNLVDGNGVYRVSQEILGRMKIEILISDPNHPIMSYLKNWKSRQENINIVHSSEDLTGGYILFLISCTEILCSEITKKYKHSLILHASDLPKGRGWSPHVWSVLEGNNLLTLSLLEAHEKVDQGSIWLKEHIALEGHELFDEINDKLFQAEIRLMTEAIDKANVITPKSQAGLVSNYYRKRTPDDSRLNIHQSLIDQFNLLRISDKNRYPAFFEHLGHKYIVRIEKVDHES
jgi:UDP-2,4-diacetamido-2,4,6-trideoxy-beta-L-altropyranose hydrolase